MLWMTVHVLCMQHVSEELQLHQMRCVTGSLADWRLQGMFAEVLGCTVLTSSVFVTYALLIVVRLTGLDGYLPTLEKGLHSTTKCAV